MRHGTALVLCSLLASSSAWGGEPDALAELLAGTFDSQLADSRWADGERFLDRRVRLSQPALGDYVFYQQINRGEDLAVYRQRIVVLEAAADSGRIVQRSYALRAAERYIDAEAADFATLSEDDLENFMADGCEQIWTRTAEGYRGYVDPRTCRIVSSRTGKLRSIESESRLTARHLALVERGFDAQTGEQLFGTPAGEFLLLGRAPLDAGVDKPTR